VFNEAQKSSEFTNRSQSYTHKAFGFIKMSWK